MNEDEIQRIADQVPESLEDYAGAIRIPGMSESRRPSHTRSSHVFESAWSDEWKNDLPPSPPPSYSASANQAFGTILEMYRGKTINREQALNMIASNNVPEPKQAEAPIAANKPASFANGKRALDI